MLQTGGFNLTFFNATSDSLEQLRHGLVSGMHICNFKALKSVYWPATDVLCNMVGDKNFTRIQGREINRNFCKGIHAGMGQITLEVALFLKNSKAK